MDDLTGIKLELIANQLLTHQVVKVKANGHSMIPFIHDGDILTLSGIAQEPPQPGEIVAFIRNELLFIHRLLEVDRRTGMALTKGDHLLISDQLLANEEVIGRVTAIRERSLAGRQLLQRLFFRLYRYCLLIWNPGNKAGAKGIIQLTIGPVRFRISLTILRIYRFFIFL